LPVGRGWAAAAGAGGKLYVFGGAGSAGVLNDCWEFDPPK
jgi:N-acetylneuraminic acid mutarotase